MYLKQSSSILHRKAIDPEGCLGSLYDGHNDRLLETAGVKNCEKQIQEIKRKRCNIIKGCRNQVENILKHIDVEDELRLSLLLNLTKRTGIATCLDYPYSIDEFTRIFYYSYVDRRERLCNNSSVTLNSNEPIKPLTRTRPTHIVTGIETGIDIIAIIKLPFNTKQVPEIDSALREIRNLLIDNGENHSSKKEHKKYLKMISHIHVYSNVLEVQKIQQITDLFEYIKWKENAYMNSLVRYELEHVRSICSNYDGFIATFISLPSSLIDNIENKIFQMTNTMTQLEKTIMQDLPNLLQNHRKDPLVQLQKYLYKTNGQLQCEMKRLAKFIVDMRSERARIPIHCNSILSKGIPFVENMIRDLSETLSGLKAKGDLIKELHAAHFQYVDAADFNINQGDDQRTIGRKLCVDYENECVLCSTDALNKLEPDQLRRLRREINEEVRHRPDLRLIYADFSYCSFELKNLMKLPVRKYANIQSHAQRIPIISLKASDSTTPVTMRSSKNKTNETTKNVMQTTSGIQWYYETKSPTPLKVSMDLSPLDQIEFLESIAARKNNVDLTSLQHQIITPMANKAPFTTVRTLLTNAEENNFFLSEERETVKQVSARSRSTFRPIDKFKNDAPYIKNQTNSGWKRKKCSSMSPLRDRQMQRPALTKHRCANTVPTGMHNTNPHVTKNNMCSSVIRIAKSDKIIPKPITKPPMSSPKSKSASKSNCDFTLVTMSAPSTVETQHQAFVPMYATISLSPTSKTCISIAPSTNHSANKPNSKPLVTSRVSNMQAKSSTNKPCQFGLLTTSVQRISQSTNKEHVRNQMITMNQTKDASVLHAESADASAKMQNYYPMT